MKFPSTGSYLRSAHSYIEMLDFHFIFWIFFFFLPQVCEGAKKAGAKRVIGIDTDPSKFELGMTYCAPLQTE
jgi:hypothetical protein